MAAIITQKWRQYIAGLFREDIQDLDVSKNLYLFIGKTLPWPISDELPPLPLDTVDKQRRIWDDILALKKVKESNAYFVIPRRDWDASGETVYTPHNDKDPLLLRRPTDDDIIEGQTAVVPYVAGGFYVITDEYHVFKCLSNAGGAKSTVKPSKPLSAPFIYNGADGYSWKYMFTVQAFEIEQFLTDAWIPVKTLESDDGSEQWQVQQHAQANPGSIFSSLVLNGGTNFLNVQDSDPENPDPQLAVSGSSDTIVLSAAASGVNNIYNGATVWIVAGTGVGQQRVISGYIGASKTATVSSSWDTIPDNSSQYQILPTVQISGDGTDALAKPVVVGGVITRVDMIDVGSNYNFAVAGVLGAGGSGAQIQPQIGPGVGHGADPVAELGASFVMLRVELQYEEGDGDFPVVNDYRILGLLRNVEDSSDNIATADTLRGVSKLELSAVTGTFLSDEVITGGVSGGQSNVVQYEDLGSATGSITFVQDPSVSLIPLAVGETITGAISGATALITNILDPEVKKYSGELVAVEHRRPITRAADQKETIKYILQF
jgi:hypothetical protein